MHPSHNIFRSSTVGCARKHEHIKKGVIKELFSEIGPFVEKEGSYMTKPLETNPSEQLRENLY